VQASQPCNVKRRVHGACLLGLALLLPACAMSYHRALSPVSDGYDDEVIDADQAIYQVEVRGDISTSTEVCGRYARRRASQLCREAGLPSYKVTERRDERWGVGGPKVRLLIQCTVAPIGATPLNTVPPPAPASPPPKAAPARVGNPGKVITVLVLPLEAKSGVARDTADQVTSALAAQAGAVPGFRVLALAEIEGTMSQEQLRQVAGCNTASCAAEIAGSLNTDEIVMGTFGRFGNAYLLTLSRVNGRTATTLRRVSHKIPGDKLESTLDDLPRLVDELFAP
jgi:hypothetical protein